MQQPTYTPDLAAADLYMFPRLRSALKGQRLCDTTDIIKNARVELKMLSKMASMNVTNAFTVADRSVYLHKGINMKQILLKCMQCCVFLRNNVIPQTF
jgi:hypothetical protein